MPEGLGAVLLVLGLLTWWRRARAPFGLRTRVYTNVAVLFTTVGVGLLVAGVAT